ncbi:hypothetical protein EYR41_007686 [Orbilia oligospora]|uniref:Uncharacterized protein n=1 Tax=Orbilia oligospora TaxID=2813651 RepID=A0A8H2DSJ8_ORBOL|nr:hypothetical protein EYR41_007686 [Orbilia oligospora]
MRRVNMAASQTQQTWPCGCRNGTGQASPLYYASFGGLLDAVKDLLSHGADADAQGGHYGNALQVASAEGYEKTVELLFSHGADVDAQGEVYGNVLQAASAGGHYGTVEVQYQYWGSPLEIS